MQTNKSVLIIGFDPKFLDFSSPELAPLDLTAGKINADTVADNNGFGSWSRRQKKNRN